MLIQPNRERNWVVVNDEGRATPSASFEGPLRARSPSPSRFEGRGTL